MQWRGYGEEQHKSGSRHNSPVCVFDRLLGLSQNLAISGKNTRLQTEVEALAIPFTPFHLLLIIRVTLLQEIWAGFSRRNLTSLLIMWFCFASVRSLSTPLVGGDKGEGGD
jgi:hypothetical protein